MSPTLDCPFGCVATISLLKASAKVLKLLLTQRLFAEFQVDVIALSLAVFNLYPCRTFCSIGSGRGQSYNWRWMSLHLLFVCLVEVCIYFRFDRSRCGVLSGFNRRVLAEFDEYLLILGKRFLLKTWSLSLQIFSFLYIISTEQSHCGCLQLSQRSRRRQYLENFATREWAEIPLCKHGWAIWSNVGV